MKSPLFWAIVVIYILAILCINFYAAYQTNKKQDQDSFLVASSKMSWPVVGFSMFCGATGGSATIGTSANVLAYGLTGLTYNISRGLMHPILALTLKPLKKFKVNTVNEVLGVAFTQRDNYITGIVQSIVLLGLGAAQVLSCISVLNMFAPGIPKWLAALISILLFLLISTVGGFMGSNLANVFNTVIIVITMVVVMVLSLRETGGWSNLAANFEGTNMLSLFGGQTIGMVVATFLINTSTGWGAQNEWLQWRAGKDTASSQKGFFLAGILQLLLAIPVGVIALAGAVALPEVSASGVLIDMAQHTGGTVTVALMCIVLLSIIVSTASVYFISIPGMLLGSYKGLNSNSNLTPEKEFFLLRVLSVLTGVVVYFLAMRATNIITVALNFTSLLVPFSLLMLVLMHFPQVCRKSTCTVTFVLGLIAVFFYAVVPVGAYVALFPSIVYPCILATLAAVVLCCIFDKRKVDLNPVLYDEYRTDL